MTTFSCALCEARTTTKRPHDIPEGWSPAWREEPTHGLFTYSVEWRCPNHREEIATFICQNCGEEWQTHPATRVECPDCKAPAGAPCKRPSGHAYFGGAAHRQREQLAVDERLLPMCPQAPSATKPTLF